VTRQAKKKGLLFIISGPSGSGKTTLARKLVGSARFRDKLVRSVSLTTRPKRSGEKDKKDYFFISSEQFLRELRAGQVLEWTRYLGYYYGTPKRFIDKQLDKARHMVLCLDLKGVRAIKRQYKENTVTIFVMPPSLKSLLHRMTGRCSETKREEVRRRLKLAQRELSSVKQYDYCVVNKDLKQATKRLREIVLTEISRFNYCGKEQE
jgi:guanylate kinase